MKDEVETTCGGKLTPAIMKALGLDGRMVRTLRLNMEAGGIVTADVTLIVSNPITDDLDELAGQYTVVKK